MKTHALLLSTILLLSLVLGGCGLRVTQGSGNVITEDRPVGDFSAINFTGVGEVTIIQGENESLTVETDDNLLPYIETTVANGVLTIGKGDGLRSTILRPTDSIRFVVTVEAIDDLALSGAGKAEAAELSAENFNLSNSGAGEINISQLTANTLNVSMSGAGSITIAGEVAVQNVSMSGLGEYVAGNLLSETTNISVSGAGGATVWASDELDAQINGIGKISYYGSPQIREEINGIGWMESLGDK